MALHIWKHWNSCMTGCIIKLKRKTKGMKTCFWRWRQRQKRMKINKDMLYISAVAALVVVVVVGCLPKTMAEHEYSGGAWNGILWMAKVKRIFDAQGMLEWVRWRKIARKNVVWQQWFSCALLSHSHIECSFSLYTYFLIGDGSIFLTQWHFSTHFPSCTLQLVR